MTRESPAFKRGECQYRRRGFGPPRGGIWMTAGSTRQTRARDAEVCRAVWRRAGNAVKVILPANCAADMRLRNDSDEIQEDEIILIAGVSEALAHPLRIKLFRHIMRCNAANTPVCNKDLVAGFDYSQATISQHIKKLAKAGLVQVKRKDSFSMYYVNIGVLKKYADAAQKFERMPQPCAGVSGDSAKEP